MMIETKFDNPLESDISLEDTDTTAEQEKLLKESENMMKSVLYLKKLFGSPAMLSSIVKVDTLSNATKSEYALDQSTNMLLAKSITDATSDIYINGGRYVLLPFESFEFPVDENIAIEIKGDVSVVQSIYRSV